MLGLGYSYFFHRGSRIYAVPRNDLEAEDVGTHSCEAVEIVALLVDYVQVGVMYVNGIHSHLGALDLM